MPNYKKRKPYQTGGATKPKPPSKNETLQQRMQRMQIERNKKAKQPSQAQMDAMQRAAAQMRKERGLMELGNRQRAAAAKSKRVPSRAQQEKNQAEYERAMRARQAARSRGSTPARPRTPTPQQRANYERMVSQIQQGQSRPPSTSINRGRGIASPTIPTSRPQMRTPTPQELARLRANPNRPSMANQVQTLNQGNALKRQRIQQQIAQLQAQLRQLGG